MLYTPYVIYARDVPGLYRNKCGHDMIPIDAHAQVYDNPAMCQCTSVL